MPPRVLRRHRAALRNPASRFSKPCGSKPERVSTVEKLKHRMTSLDYYAIEELLTDDERAARDRTRRFVQEEVLDEIVPCHRAAKFPEHLRPRMGALPVFVP